MKIDSRSGKRLLLNFKKVKLGKTLDKIFLDDGFKKNYESGESVSFSRNFNGIVYETYEYCNLDNSQIDDSFYTGAVLWRQFEFHSQNLTNALKAIRQIASQVEGGAEDRRKILEERYGDFFQLARSPEYYNSQSDTAKTFFIGKSIKQRKYTATTETDGIFPACIDKVNSFAFYEIMLLYKGMNELRGFGTVDLPRRSGRHKKSSNKKRLIKREYYKLFPIYQRAYEEVKISPKLTYSKITKWVNLGCSSDDVKAMHRHYHEQSKNIPACEMLWKRLASKYKWSVSSVKKATYLKVP
jgi:curved DNA-binding protein CbpA